jgi:hypothetical protein
LLKKVDPDLRVKLNEDVWYADPDPQHCEIIVVGRSTLY